MNQRNPSQCPYQLWRKPEQNAPSSFKPSLKQKFSNINQSFLKIHSEGAQSLNNVDTILIYKGNELSLWKKNNVHDYEQIDMFVTPSEDSIYTKLKYVCHIYVMTTLKLGELVNKNFQERYLLIESILTDILSIRDDEEFKDYFGKYCDNQLFILNKTLDLLNDIVDETFSIASLDKIKNEYINSVQEAVAVNLKKAAKSQINELDDKMQEWDLINEDTLKSMRIVIVGPQGPKDGHLTKQYLEELYKTFKINEVITNYLFYIECLPNKFSSLDVKKDIIDGYLRGIGTNKIVGKELLNNEKGMFSDILKDYGPEIINKLFLDKAENLRNQAHTQNGY